jgi:teichoic acid transport system permease protein
MSTIFATISHTPWWVYVLLIVLIRRGMAMARSRVTQVWKLAILPTIFFIFDVVGISQNHAITGFLVLLWIISLGLGGTVAYFLVRDATVRADRKNWLIRLQGDKRVLFLILIVFTVKYGIAWLTAAAPALSKPHNFIADSLALSGFFTGIFFGRSCVSLVKFFTVPSKALTPGAMPTDDDQSTGTGSTCLGTSRLA